MLSDSNKLRNVQSRKKRAINAATNLHWSDSQKLEAVTTYLALGNLVLTASVLKIPEVTLRKWKQAAWWKELEGELRVQEDIQLSSRLKRIIETTLSATEDRINNGDWMFDSKNSELIRKPVAMKDVHRVTMDMIDKREMLAGKETQSIAIEAVEDRLAKLAQKFAEIAEGRRPIEVTDVIIGREDVRNIPDSPAP